ARPHGVPRGGAPGGVPIRAWVTRFLSAGHHLVASHFQVTGNAVAWNYRVPLPDALNVRLPQFRSAAGTAKAVVVAGRIETLPIACAPATPVPTFQPVATAPNSQSRTAPSSGARVSRRSG